MPDNKEMTAADRRRFRRLATRAPLLGRSRGPDGVEGMVMNMSEGGLSFESPRALASGTKLDLEITPPDATLPMAKLHVIAQVRWCAPSQETPGHHWIGVMFLPDGRDHRQGILKFVDDWTLPQG
ncbi:MAG: PilZ domain-containing protein [Acidobacteriota bacterium]